MEHIFFRMDVEFEIAVQKVFTALGIISPMTCDSLNTLGGLYGCYMVFGVKIKLERNCYDFEDRFNS